MHENLPLTDPLHQVGDMVMGFAENYAVSGKIEKINWNEVNLEWEYFVVSGDGYSGKLKERKVLKFDNNIWKEVESTWKDCLDLINRAHEKELKCRRLLAPKK